MMALADFKNAYDSVLKMKLMDKLQATGVKGRMLKWLTNFITQCFCKTKFGNKLSKYKSEDDCSRQKLQVPPFSM
jgi:hypothetical protein